MSEWREWITDRVRTLVDKVKADPSDCVVLDDNISEGLTIKERCAFAGLMGWSLNDRFVQHWIRTL